RFSGKKGFAIWFNESDSALELFERNFWKSIGRFLIGGIINFAGGDFAPAFDPAPAKMTFAVPNHEWLRWRIGNAEMSLHALVSRREGGSCAPRAMLSVCGVAAIFYIE